MDNVQEQQRIEEGLKVIGSMERPVPGQSLTSSPDSPRPFEGPPKYTTVREANGAIFRTLIEEENFSNVVRALGEGVPVGDIASTILYAGFTEGQWNPDLMLALAEPTMYMVLAMGERVGIHDMRMYAGEDDDVQDDPMYQSKLGEAANISSFVKPDVDVGSIPENIKEKLASIDIESLLAKPEQPEQVSQDRGSLLSPQPQEEIRG